MKNKNEDLFSLIFTDKKVQQKSFAIINGKIYPFNNDNTIDCGKF